MATTRKTPFNWKDGQGPQARKGAVDDKQREEVTRKADGLRWRHGGEVGTFTVIISVAHPDIQDFVEVEAIVDTGSSDTVLPTSLLEQLGIERKQHILVEDANRFTTASHIGVARINWGGAEWDCPVIFGVEDVYLLGATTLELFKLTVDMAQERLVPTVLRRRPL